MSAILDLINFTKLVTVTPEGDAIHEDTGKTPVDQSDEAVAERAKRSVSMRPEETIASPQEEAAEDQKRQSVASKVGGYVGGKVKGLAVAPEVGKLEEAEMARDERKAKYLEDKSKQGFLGRHLGYLTETGLGAAAQQRAEGTAASQSQGPVQSSPGGVGTGKASAFARQKGAKAPPLQGKVPNLSTQVRMQNPKPPKVPTPQQMPVGQKMEKEDDAGYNIKGRPQRNVRGQKDKGDMKVTGKGVQNLQRIVVDRAKKLKDKEDTA